MFHGFDVEEGAVMFRATYAGGAKLVFHAATLCAAIVFAVSQGETLLRVERI